MKKEIKGFILGVLSTIMLTGGVTFAYSQYKTIDVAENSVTIYANDKLVSAPNFVYNNTTYVPLRAVLEQMDCTVFFDSENSSVYAYNNFEEVDLPMVYAGQEYSSICKYTLDADNDQLAVSGIYIDSQLLRDMETISTYKPDNEDRVYITELGTIDSYPTESYYSTTTPDSSYYNSLIKFPLHLYSNDGKQYLGKLVTNKYDSDSIWNSYGDYGSKYNSNSIWNSYGDYGSKYSNTSAFNEHASKPPKIVDDNGDVVGYLTTNKYITGGVTIEQLSLILDKNNQ